MADAANTASIREARIALGLCENWQQFTLLVLINAFVGGMVGLERTLVPLIGSETFQLASTAAVTSFIVSFGIVKAITNLVSGQLADTWGRKKTLLLGWPLGLPVPFLILWAPAWGWIVAANVLLGINQGLSWSMTVIMKVDLVGPRQRGLAVGLNEFAGYLAVGVTAFLTGYFATLYGLRPVPFYRGAANSYGRSQTFSVVTNCAMRRGRSVEKGQVELRQSQAPKAAFDRLAQDRLDFLGRMESPWRCRGGR